MRIEKLEIEFVKELLRAPVQGQVVDCDNFPLDDFLCCLCLHFNVHALVSIAFEKFLWDY